MYTLITTFPQHSTGNVGDYLITQSAKDLIIKIKGEQDFKVIWRLDDLSDSLGEINKTKAVLLPGFAIRKSTYPDIYKLVPDLEKIKVPIIPIGAGWKQYPGDFISTKKFYEIFAFCNRYN